MPQTDVCVDTVSRFDTLLSEQTQKRAVDPANVSTAALPGVIDVMGGIGEDAGSLVLTAPVGHTIRAAAFPSADKKITVELHAAPAHEVVTMPADALVGNDGRDAIRKQCRNEKADWAAPLLLALSRAASEGFLPEIHDGLHVMIHDGAPEMADVGRTHVRVATALAACCADGLDHPRRAAFAALCADSIDAFSALRSVRTPLTALMNAPGAALMQLRFSQPQTLCEPLALPDNVTIRGVITRLARPTTHQRMVETRTCSEMGHRLILDLLRQDGVPFDATSHRLASVTPPEFVERYRDRMPSRITRDAFVNQFGALRGLDDNFANPKGVYKIRSRAEHHIYENKRVHDFVTLIARARRTGGDAALIAAGELMYASHWSHSQRCGIGGVEADRLVKLIRDQGENVGLFGAKVTGGGAGGELVVLMRNDETANAALHRAVDQARSEFKQEVIVYAPPRPAAMDAPKPA
ncbi:MAG TPA: hypothetical protein P5081_17370 [Phycisphaerae bacterium]|nr:hypothetical protein [Phycisphaerae bacterium]HRW54643.1 hypothetical protein [Phycisphaerae bacterium]